MILLLLKKMNAAPHLVLFNTKLFRQKEKEVRHLEDCVLNLNFKEPKVVVYNGKRREKKSGFYSLMGRQAIIKESHE